MIDVGDVLELERIAFRAFPADVEQTIGGFVCRRTTDGVARRWNSATTIPGATIDAAAQLPQVERFYAAAARPPLVRVLSAVDPALDGALAELGWVAEAATVVCAVPIDRAGSRPDLVASGPSTEWCHVKARSRNLTETQLAAWLRRTRNIPGAVGYASSLDDIGDIVGIGVGVADRDWLGVFDMYVEPAHRRHGRGSVMLADLMAWGLRRGCRQAYLQVMVENQPALDLYAGFGFEERYRYWYRRKSEADST